MKNLSLLRSVMNACITCVYIVYFSVDYMSYHFESLKPITRTIAKTSECIFVLTLFKEDD